MDAKSNMEEGCEKLCNKKALSSKFGALGCVLEAWGAPGASQERPKSGPRRPQELRTVEARALCDALGRSWALFGVFLRFCSNFGQFFIDLCYEKFWELGFLAGAACCLLLLSWSLSSKSVPAFAGFCLLVPVFARSRVELILNLNSS